MTPLVLLEIPLRQHSATAASIYRIPLILQVNDTDITCKTCISISLTHFKHNSSYGSLTGLTSIRRIDRWVDLGVWSAIEPNLAITVASLARCRPLFLQLTRELKGLLRQGGYHRASVSTHAVPLPRSPRRRLEDNHTKGIGSPTFGRFGLHETIIQGMNKPIDLHSNTSRVDIDSLKPLQITDEPRGASSDGILVTRELSITRKPR